MRTGSENTQSGFLSDRTGGHEIVAGASAAEGMALLNDPDQAFAGLFTDIRLGGDVRLAKKLSMSPEAIRTGRWVCASMQHQLDLT